MEKIADLNNRDRFCVFGGRDPLVCRNDLREGVHQPAPVMSPLLNVAFVAIKIKPYSWDFQCMLILKLGAYTTMSVLLTHDKRHKLSV